MADIKWSPEVDLGVFGSLQVPFFSDFDIDLVAALAEQLVTAFDTLEIGGSVSIPVEK